MSRRFLALALAVPAALIDGAVPPAHAIPLAVIEGRALDVSAQRLEVDVEKGTALLQGDVVITLGDLEVKCPSVDLRYDRSPRVSWAKGTGGVVARLRGIEATASALELDVNAHALKLEGNVKVTRGRGWATAERATVDIGTGKVSLEDVRGSIPVVLGKQ